MAPPDAEGGAPGLRCRSCGSPFPGTVEACVACGEPVPAEPGEAPPPPAAGAALGLPARYEVVRFLGNGAMGRVYRCRDSELDVDVALKVLLPQVAADEDSLRMIRREARAAARLRECPGILPLYGFERAGESWYIVMAYAPGGTLQDRLAKKGVLPEPECRRIGAEVAEALAYAHARAVLHRDIKPANILFAGDSRTLVADFGLSRVMEGGGVGPTTVTLAGTPVYMAPEIMLRQPTDGRADQYSLGCTLFEAATGHRPYKGNFAQMAVTKADPLLPPPDPREVLPELGEGFAAAVRRMLFPDPHRRFADARAAAAALRA